MKTMRVLIAMVFGLAFRAGAEELAAQAVQKTEPVALSTVSATNRAPLSSGDYLVIDISGGSSTSRYAKSYLEAVPVGGWTEEFKTTRMVFRRIPAAPGTVVMGSPEDETGRSPDEVQHEVTLTNEFFIGVFEVTQRQWELVMGDRPSYFNNATFYATRPVEQVSYEDIRGDDDGAMWPATNTVDRSSFLGRLRRKTALPFDLPTEAQWEFACRAGTTTALNSGHTPTSVDSDQHLDTVARYWSNSRFQLRQGCPPSAATAMVGSYLPNEWGLYDLHGNVWEWCLDWYGKYPGAGTNPVGAVSGPFRVLRGGSWSYGASYCRSAFRYYYGSQFTSTTLNCYDFGFRVSLTLP
ncbi:MAG: formylglycine-generating enzyme family protein [bacterium]